MDEDVVGLQRALMGEDLAVCDLCGAPETRLSVVRSVAEAGEYLHVCPECRDRIERDELPIDAEIVAGLQVADE
jgi:hypothetical protein